MKIKKVKISEDFIISKSFEKIDYSDAYMIEDNFNNKELTVEDIVKAVFGTFSGWIDWLFHIRNVLVKPFGIKSDSSSIKKDYKNFKGVIGESIDFFEVYDRSADEIMLGMNDKHLDARISFILKKDNYTFSIILITTVHFNNWLGKLYFIPVKPFHKLIIKSSLRKTVKN